MARAGRRGLAKLIAMGALTASSLLLFAGSSSSAATATSGVVGLVSTIPALGLRVEGTGLVLSRNGIVLTNNHLIRGASQIMVQTRRGSSYHATVLGYDVTGDVAVLQLARASGLEPSTFDARADAAVGTAVTPSATAPARTRLRRCSAIR